MERSRDEGPDLAPWRTETHTHPHNGSAGQQLAERRRAPSAISEPVRLLSRALYEGSRARRREEPSPAEQRCRRFESPLGAVHHANRLKAATPAPPGPCPPLPPRDKSTPISREYGEQPGPPPASIHPIHTQVSSSPSNPGPQGG